MISPARVRKNTGVSPAVGANWQFAGTATAARDCSSDETHQLVLRFIRAFNAGKTARLDALFAEDDGDGNAATPSFQWYSTGPPGQRFGRIADDRSTLMHYFAMRHNHGERLRLLWMSHGGTAPGKGYFDFAICLTGRPQIAVWSVGYQGGEAAGTGMVLTSSGEVLTNNHVIEGATSIKVIVPSTGQSYKADVLGYSVTADTALLKLEGASGLATVRTGDSSKLRRGQLERAVGNAGGTGRLTSVTGRVTGLGRTITAGDDRDIEQLTGLIETNAAVQSGDSGGPLLDSSGRVEGMITAASESGGFYFQSVTNDAYAIPINSALKVVKQIESGRSTASMHVGGTAFLGVQISSPGYGEGAAGAVVAGVVSGSAADRAGLTTGDEITTLDGHSVTSPDGLRALLLLKHPGDKVMLTWLDQLGTQHTASVTLGSGSPQ
jgi:S1-C subfamily serine protease